MVNWGWQQDSPMTRNGQPGCCHTKVSEETRRPTAPPPPIHSRASTRSWKWKVLSFVKPAPSAVSCLASSSLPISDCCRTPCTQTVPSWEPEAKKRPSGLHRAHTTYFLWSWKVWTTARVCVRASMDWCQSVFSRRIHVQEANLSKQKTAARDSTDSISSTDVCRSKNTRPICFAASGSLPLPSPAPDPSTNRKRFKRRGGATNCGQ